MKGILYFLIGLIVVAVAVAFEGLIIMWLWNWLAVSLFCMNEITWFTGFGIALTLSIVGNFFK